MSKKRTVAASIEKVSPKASDEKEKEKEKKRKDETDDSKDV